MKAGVAKYVKIMKRLMFACGAILLPTLMVLLVFTVNSENKGLFISLVVVDALLFFTLYGFYTVRVSLGAVLQLETNSKMMYLKTSRKVFSYDLKRECVKMKIYPNRFVATFRTQDSEDSFTFYRHVPFTPYQEEQFTMEEMRQIFPQIDDIEE